MHEAEFKHGIERVFVRSDMGSMPGTEATLVIVGIDLCIVVD